MNDYVLNNGVKMPSVGIGTFLLEPADAENSVRVALQAGYRLVDTANMYMNERAVGRGMRASGVKREDIFLSTKLWPNEYTNENAVDVHDDPPRPGKKHAHKVTVRNHITDSAELDKVIQDLKTVRDNWNDFNGVDFDWIVSYLDFSSAGSSPEESDLCKCESRSSSQKIF